jgi:archaellin
MTDFNLTYELRDIGTNTGRWNIVQQDTDETLEIVDAATRGEAVDYAHEKYSGGPDNVNFYVIPYTGNQESKPKPKLSRRAKLATQIAQPKDYVIINKHSLLPFYTFRASTMSQAVDFAVTYLQDKNLDVGNFTVQRASNVKQAVDNAVDSRRMQQRLDPQVRDIDITIDQDSGQYEIVDRRNNRVMLQYRADDAADAGDKFNNWLRNQGMPADTENYGYRPMVAVNESIDDAQKARNAMDAAAKKLGYANFAAVPQSAKNTVMQMAVNALKLDNGHYNMLDRKNKR